jgi:hypothetical protein
MSLRLEKECDEKGKGGGGRRGGPPGGAGKRRVEYWTVCSNVHKHKGNDLYSRPCFSPSK